MEEIEVPTEHLHEEINERAKEQKEEKKWFFYVAISTALMAVFAAIASLIAGHESNEALIQQIKASDQWSYYQAKGIKAEIAVLLPAKDDGKIEKYKKEQEAIKKVAETDEKNSEAFLEKHKVMAKSVTFFQIAIAICAVSILSGKRVLWYGALLLACTGIWFFASGFF